MGFTIKQYILILGMLLTGTINTVSKKLQLDCAVPGYYNWSANGTTTEHNFNKPWFQTLLMFLGECLCLIGFLVARWRKRRRLRNQGMHEIFSAASQTEGIANKPLFHWVFLIPASCDLLGTTLAGIGLLFIDASIWQMMRGSLIIFAGILSMVFLKRRLRCFNWTGMSFTVTGLTLVGLTSVFNSNALITGGAKSAAGVALVLAGSFTSACQMVLEEVFLKKHGFHPLQAVGMEGLFGSILMIVIALPIVHFIPGPDLNGSYENVLDALYQIKNSPLLIISCIFYILSIAFFNYFGLSITRSLSSVHRTLIDALRTLLVWLVGLVIYYGVSHQFGEAFSPAWGLVQIDGFAFLVIGTCIYNEIIDLSSIPCCVTTGPSEVLGSEFGIHDGVDNSVGPSNDDLTTAETGRVMASVPIYGAVHHNLAVM